MAELQRDLLGLMPSSLEVDASALIEVSGLEIDGLKNQIIKPQPAKSTVFIYSPIKQQDSARCCSVGDILSFSLTLTGPLAISIRFDMIALTVTNGISYPKAMVLPLKHGLKSPLTITATDVGQLEVTDFTFVAGNVTGTYRLPTLIALEVIQQLPTHVIKKRPRFDTSILENSNQRLVFEVLNTSKVAVNLKRISFRPLLAVLTAASLPIIYPPKVEPPLPDSLGLGEARTFALSWLCDKTITLLSYTLEYGIDTFRAASN
jgi:hypothetical protein